MLIYCEKKYYYFIKIVRLTNRALAIVLQLGKWGRSSPRPVNGRQSGLQKPPAAALGTARTGTYGVLGACLVS